MSVSFLLVSFGIDQRLVGRILGTDGHTDFGGWYVNALGMIVERDGHLLLQHIELDHLAHARWRADALAYAGQRAAHLAVDLVLEREAAEQASADAGNAVWVEREVLVLGDANADVGEVGHPARAAESQAADVITVDQASAFALVGLLHVEADVVLVLDFVEQRAEIDVIGRLEPGGALIAVEVQFDGDWIQADVLLHGRRAHVLEDLIGPLGLLFGVFAIICVREPDDGAHIPGDWLRWAFFIGHGDDSRELVAARAVHHDIIAGKHLAARGSEVVDTSCLADANADHHLVVLS